MRDKERWHYRCWNVVRGAERPWLNVQHNSVVICIKQVDRSPKVEEPDGKGGEGPPPGHRGNGDEGKYRGTKISPCRWDSSLRGKLRRTRSSIPRTGRCAAASRS